MAESQWEPSAVEPGEQEGEWAQVGFQVGTQVESQVGSQVESQVGVQVGSRWGPDGVPCAFHMASQVKSLVGFQVGLQPRPALALVLVIPSVTGSQ